MADGDDNQGAMSRRGFLRGDFLTAETEPEPTQGDGGEEEDRDGGAAVDLEAILERAESIAGVSERAEETPHPFYQEAGFGDPD